MPELPKFIVYTARWGWNNGSEFRFARDDKHVRNILRGLYNRYGPDLDTAVFVVGETFDVTNRYVIPKETK
ncbi:hypothetical protein [Streptomyces narbonensis]|uniref:hypothetical protein n=1 Tax=Streptomyces narbonensis TaxID=67333 RepID=UPI0033EB3A7E